jgi:hypothetical protein
MPYSSYITAAVPAAAKDQRQQQVCQAVQCRQCSFDALNAILQLRHNIQYSSSSSSSSRSPAGVSARQHSAGSAPLTRSMPYSSYNWEQQQQQQCEQLELPGIACGALLTC